MCCPYRLPTQEASNRVHRDRRICVLPAQVVENLHVQRPVMPLVRFIEIDGDLYCHCVRHFTVPAPGPCLRAWRPGTAGCCRECWSASVPTGLVRNTP